MHLILTRLYTLLHDDSFFHWNKEHEAVVLQVKQTLTQNCELTLPNTENLFLIWLMLPL